MVKENDLVDKILPLAVYCCCHENVPTLMNWYNSLQVWMNQNREK